MPGTFVWYELMTTDAPAACAFYRQVIGWASDAAQMPGLDYTLMSNAHGQVAGVMPLPAEVLAAGGRPAWSGFVEVDDVDASTAAAQAAGARVCVAPQDIPGVGRFATLADPQGAVFNLYRGNAGPEKPQPSGAAGAVGWHELMAREPAGAWAFYRGLFGWAAGEAIDMGEAGSYQLFSAAPGAEAMGGLMQCMPGMPVPCWQYYINVPAIDAAVARIGTAGGQVLNGPMQVPGGSWIVNAVDPQGAMFSLVAPAR